MRDQCARAMIIYANTWNLTNSELVIIQTTVLFCVHYDLDDHIAAISKMM
jgi:hypothetical protein